MEKNLTKDEIDDLLAAVFSGEIDLEKELAATAKLASKFDLVNNDSRKVLAPNLDIIFDSFIRSNRVTMSSRLGKIVEIKKAGSQSYKFDDFLQSLPSPVCMSIFKLEPLKGASLIAMDSTLVFTIVDSILGGVGAPNIPANNRLFTPIELRLVEKIIKDALADMEKAWAPVNPVTVNHLRMEMNPRLVNIVPPDYQVTTMTFQIQVEETIGTMIVAIPFMTIEPIRDKFKAGVQFDMMAIDPLWSYRLSNELIEAPLDISVEVGGAVISLAELLHLVPGDTIMLDGPGRHELTVKVGGVGKFLGNAGVREGNKAVQISRSLFQGGEQ